MSAIKLALERGREKSKGRFEPVAVEHRGWLVAVIEDKERESTDRVYFQGTHCYFYQPSRGMGEEQFKLHEVKRRELRNVARAMLYGAHRDDLVNETRAVSLEQMSTNGGGRVRRKK